MEEKVIQIISERTNHTAEYLSQHQTEQKLWDSLQRIEIVLALEEDFDLMFEPEEIEAMFDVQNIIRIISGKVA